VDEQQASFQLYYELVAWNKFNLTAVTGMTSQFAIFSILCRAFWPGAQLAMTPSDRRSSASAPGRISSIPSVGLSGIHLPSRGDRQEVIFLDMVNRLALRGSSSRPRWGDRSGPIHRQQWLLARAVADLVVVVEYTLPLCRLGGWVIAQKGEAAAAETWNAQKAIALLGGELRRMIPVELPGLPENRSLVVIEKTGPTPDIYPRRPGLPSKKPLLG
jgi:16S rRNA (guanine527-N7)-methyltransferase